MSLIQKLFGSATIQKGQTSPIWVKDLDGLDDISAIELTTDRLSEDFKKNFFQNESNTKVLFSVDEKTHTFVERITFHYVKIENIGAELEERISSAVYLYHRQLFITYLSIIKNGAHEQSTLHLLLARAMHNATRMIKWRYYNYQSAPANVWSQLSELYLIAEKQSLLNAKIQPYQDSEPLSLSSAYIHACMLGTLESLSLKCQQIELVSKMLIAWTNKLSIDNAYNESLHLFYIDTTTNRPARRIRNFKPAPTYRYWSFDSVNSKIELCISLIEFNITPKQPLMQEIVRDKDAISMLEILHTEWSRVDYKRQRRSEDRSPTTMSASTAYGLKETCEQIKQHEIIRAQQRGESIHGADKSSNKSLEERLAMHSLSRIDSNVIYMDLSTDLSTVVDHSDKGLGLKVTKHAHEVSLDMLVGISSKEQKYSTKVGMIRSIRPMPNQALHIGIQLLSKVAFSAEAKNLSMAESELTFSNSQNTPFANTTFGDTATYLDTNFGADPHSFMCLYLPKEQSISKQETLIIPKLQYNKNNIFKVNLLGEDMLIRFTKSLEHQGNWVRVTFTTDITSKPVVESIKTSRPASA